MGVLDSITDALSGKGSSGASDTQVTRLTPEDIAATQRIRNSPQFQAALRARAQPMNPGNFAFQPPLPTRGPVK